VLRGWIPRGLMPIFGHLAACSEAVKAVEAYDGRDLPPGHSGNFEINLTNIDAAGSSGGSGAAGRAAPC